MEPKPKILFIGTSIKTFEKWKEAREGWLIDYELLFLQASALEYSGIAADCIYVDEALEFPPGGSEK